jgi:peptidoglycan/xylan/chitin deacetylase (PgdA/CDA1 family)
MNPWEIVVPAAIAVAGGYSYGAVHPRAQIFGVNVHHTNSPRQLAITFDDGPNPAITPKLLQLLELHKVPATFFVVGKFVRDCPDLTREIAARGHLIGNHTYTHPNLSFTGPGETRDELLRCSEAIANATQSTPRWFRPPYGFRSPWTGQIAQQLGMRSVLWTLLPGDWRVKPADWLIERLKPIAARAQSKSSTHGDVLCLHDGYYRHLNGDRTHTLQALEYWLPRWRDLGLEFVTMAHGTEYSAQ